MRSQPQALSIYKKSSKIRHQKPDPISGSNFWHHFLDPKPVPWCFDSSMHQSCSDYIYLPLFDISDTLETHYRKIQCKMNDSWQHLISSHNFWPNWLHILINKNDHFWLTLASLEHTMRKHNVKWTIPDSIWLHLHSRLHIFTAKMIHFGYIWQAWNTQWENTM